MNIRLPVILKRLVSSSLALLTAIVLIPCAANATPYVVKLVQQGNNVVATGSGAIDLTGLTIQASVGNVPYTAGLAPIAADVSLGPLSNYSLMDYYTGVLTGPTNFGVGGGTNATTGTGNLFEFYPGGLLVPIGYVSDTALANGATFDNATFASLGVTPGTYTWTWGTGADQSFALVTSIASASVPEPAALSMFSLGMLLICGFVTLSRRELR